MARPCMTPGCPELVTGRHARCPAHTDPAFANAPRRALGRTWGRTRRAVLRRDGYRCRVCGDTATQVDHRLPRVYGGTDDPENLRALCSDCHMVATQAAANQVKQGMKRYSDPHRGA